MCRCFKLRGALCPVFVGIKRLPVEGSVKEQVQFSVDYRICFRVDGKLGILCSYTPSAVTIKLRQIAFWRFFKGILICFAGKVIGCPMMLYRIAFATFLSFSRKIGDYIVTTNGKTIIVYRWSLCLHADRSKQHHSKKK